MEACEATHVRGEQSADLLDRRMACLSKSEVEFQALVEVLHRGGSRCGQQRDRRPRQSLEPVARCADAAALEPEALPRDPAKRERVEELQGEIARVDALANAGKYNEAARMGRQVVTDARDIGHAPTIWQAGSTLAAVYSTMGRGEDALAVNMEALEVAEVARLDYKRGATFIDLAYIHGIHLGDLEQARWYAKSAHAVLDRIGGGKRRRAELLSNEAIVVTLGGDIDEALALSGEAVRLREEAGIGEDLVTGTLRTNLGGALYAAGRYEEALEQYREAHRIRKEALGDWHPTLAVSLENIGNAMQALERYDEALEYHRAALDLTRSGSTTGAKLGLQHNNVAVALFGMGRLEEAREHYLEAAAAYRSVSQMHPAFGVTLCNLGELELRLGKVDDAHRHYEEALALFDERVPPDHPWRILALTGLGGIYVDKGEAERAMPHLQRAMEILAKGSLEAIADAEVKLQYGRALWEVEPGERARARELVDGARAELQKLGGRATVPLQTARKWLQQHPL